MYYRQRQPSGISTDIHGVGVGGHCIPVDPYYMIQRAADVGVPAGLITAARAVNRSMPSHVAGVLSDLMWSAGVAAKDAKVLLLGWGHTKPNLATQEKHLLNHWLKH